MFINIQETKRIGVAIGEFILDLSAVVSFYPPEVQVSVRNMTALQAQVIKSVSLPSAIFYQNINCILLGCIEIKCAEYADVFGTSRLAFS